VSAARIGREPSEPELRDVLLVLDESGRGFEPSRTEMAQAAWLLMQRAEYEMADRLAAAGYAEAAEAIREAQPLPHRPLPTGAQIDALLQEWKPTRPLHETKVEVDNYRRRLRNALLDLINGE
jgi:hypothetical protein